MNLQSLLYVPELLLHVSRGVRWDSDHVVTLTGDFTARLALLEKLKGMPTGVVWDYYCLQQDMPVGLAFVDEIRRYEGQVLVHRE